MKYYRCDICGKDIGIKDWKNYGRTLSCVTKIRNVISGTGDVYTDTVALDVCPECEAKIKLAKAKVEMRIVNHGVWNRKEGVK